MTSIGVSSTEIASSEYSTASCRNCKSRGTLKYTVRSDHLYVYHIPTLPVGKRGYSVCSHCGISLEREQMNSEQKREIDPLIKESKVPVWKYTGLGLVLFLVIAIYSVLSFGIKRTEQYAQFPRVMDVYSIKKTDGAHTKWRLKEITKDSLSFEKNIKSVKSSSIEGINWNANYTDSLYSLSKLEVQEMLENGTIYKIYRRKRRFE